MKHNSYKLFQPLVAGILVVSVFIQSCSNLTTVSVSMDDGPITDNISEVDIQAPFKQPADNQLITENQASFYPKADQSRVRVQEEAILLTEKGKEKEEQQKLGSAKNNDVNSVKEKAESLVNLKEISRGGEEAVAMSLGKLAVLPIEIVEKILTYVPCDKIKMRNKGQQIATGIFAVRQINRLFYELTTGYSEPGLVGVEHRPNRRIVLEACAINKVVRFRNLNVATLPSFLFYQLIKEVSNLSKEFWPYLRETNIHTIGVYDISLCAAEAVELAKNLEGTKVHTLEFTNNSFDSKHIGVGIGELAKNLQGSRVDTVKLRRNSIVSKEAVEFAKNLKDTNVYTVDLSHNSIGSKGIAELAKNLQDTQVRILDISGNYIGGDEIAEFAKNLQGTYVHTVNLSHNDIESACIGEFAKNLQGTNVHTLNLNSNDIEAAHIGEFAKNLKGTNVHTLNLSHNKIGVKGAIELAKNLTDTNVEKVNLSFNEIKWNKAKYPKELMEFAQILASTNVRKIGFNRCDVWVKEQQLLLKQHSNIKWEF